MTEVALTIEGSLDKGIRPRMWLCAGQWTTDLAACCLTSSESAVGTLSKLDDMRVRAGSQPTFFCAPDPRGAYIGPQVPDQLLMIMSGKECAGVLPVSSHSG